MKFTDGYWEVLPGMTALYAQEAYTIREVDGTLVVVAPTKRIEHRGDTLNRPTITVTLSSPADGVVRVRLEHHRGTRGRGGFDLPGADGERHGTVAVSDGTGSLTSGRLTATVRAGAPWSLEFADSTEGHLTGSGNRSIGYITDPAGRHFVHEQLELGVGEYVYGLGERFGPLVKNGQTVDIWNADGGTSSEQAYKNIPFYLTNKGYGVLVDDPGRVSFEVGSESVERVQFSAEGESLEYLVVAGPTPKDVLERYTALAGRPALVPAWSYGLWLSTSFTTDYDEATVMSFLDGFAERDLPLSAFHFDCFWMREFHWTDFTWDPGAFPDPDGLLDRLHARGLRVCVWINPYIAQESRLFKEGADAGYLVRKPDGDVWQWDMWQAGMALVDFTNPDAVAWYQGYLRQLIGQGVDSFKTDFGERIPIDVQWHDGSDPEAMHNLYAQRYNAAVHEVLVDERGPADAVLFARSATIGGQTMPVHWGGDNSSSHVSMAETLRGGLSLAMGGFGFWAHDIGGFEGLPDAGVFKRWLAFGLLSSHSRLHGSSSYRVPWQFDDEAVAITRTFSKLKLALMPYLFAAGVEAHEKGIPVMRPMALEFDDRAVAHIDTQYMLGPDLLVAPVFSADGSVEVYLPHGRWINWFTEEVVEGGTWRAEQHGFETLPLYVREGAVIPMSSRERPDGGWFDGLSLHVFPGHSEVTDVTVYDHETAEPTTYRVTRGINGAQVAVAEKALPSLVLRGSNSG
ncbi:alpha-xylosidase [Curtobacterium albidum]|uniref:alpha-D-xyloside xylohydrolase n=1 Tax=Curtobacterium citreum TaxID=2036 RepID=A0A850DW86_9MICO|nr:alpha-xylosidase [Curtobacterium albidum]NUU29211.1 alpha-xylosidase [Curtobacterium albidum]